MYDDSIEAEKIITKLLNSPIAPGLSSYLLNVGTDHILDILEKNYFKKDLERGISSFKYVQGYYGSGKTQFINSLATRALNNEIVSAIVDIGRECPFNSPFAIYKSVMSSLIAPHRNGKMLNENKGIEVVIGEWVKNEFNLVGVTDYSISHKEIREQIERKITTRMDGPKDSQAYYGIRQLCFIKIKEFCNESIDNLDEKVIMWMCGDKVFDRELKSKYNLTEVVNDTNAFNRLMTIFKFLRTFLGYRGFYVAFDEGSRTSSFRRGSIAQKQSVENMLSMINRTKDDEFAGMLFLYAATPEFKTDVIVKYPALNDRIGDAKFNKARPMVPFIDLDELDTKDIIVKLGKKLIELFRTAFKYDYNLPIQTENIYMIFDEEINKYGSGSEIRRSFVYHYCIFLNDQGNNNIQLTKEKANNLVMNNDGLNTDCEE